MRATDTLFMNGFFAVLPQPEILFTRIQSKTRSQATFRRAFASFRALSTLHDFAKSSRNAAYY